MAPKDRAMFIAAYSRLVAEVWADPAAERQLTDDPRGLLAQHGLPVPEGVEIRVVRETADAEPNIDVQVRAWEAAVDSGVLTLFIPRVEPLAPGELDEDELDRVVGGIDASCACCCPCCSTT
ncbi:hypothetical protein [Plantactinospora sp. B5E13]|uniref:hypothetical protein n=1 Tax=unclassified Plantactinospora TaxID=2631981 RepID=UPI00325ED2A4